MSTSDGVGARVVQTAGPVLIIGSGLLGASLGLALRAGGVRVYLEDASPTSLRLASDVGAGQAFGDVLAEAGCTPASVARIRLRIRRRPSLSSRRLRMSRTV